MAILTATADLIYREIHSGGGKRVMARPVSDPVVVDELLEKALSTELMTGNDWDALSCGLVVAKGRAIKPHIPAVTDRLLRELLISDGQGWINRNEAAHRLLRNRAFAPDLIAVCAAVVSDPTNQVFNEPMTILEAAGGRLAARHVINAIVRPINEQARQAAWWTAAEKVTRGHFSPADRAILTREAAALLTQERLVPARMAAADLLRRTPHIETSLRRALAPAIARDELVHSVYTSGRTSRQHQPLVDRITRMIAACVPDHQPGDDLMLSWLVEEALLHPHFSRRVIAARMLAATPYRRSAGRVITAELRTPVSRADVVLASHLVQSLTAVGDHLGREAVQELILDPTVAAPVRDAAIWSVAHVPSDTRMPTAFWNDLCGMIATPAGAGNARAVAYAAGIARQQGVLRRIKDDSRLAAPARIAAYWWLNHPRHIQPSSI
ncbi:hypothetical protein F4553_002073 [Allocatelliglobosispora scoriae]|uniref:Uncharacterized protein n=1 Tax=Allocatelliglobosispora scoriae TaxID=643052 RepID=A0A841BK95_9ACTN|nr:hypothetical protein [Allocatelliglobosispora scoriae]MBB5868694.1 hypothetical protein [Allocatelliglobosispora scoriae]